MVFHQLLLTYKIQIEIVEFCDPTVKQFLLHMDEKNVLGEKFIIEDLDATHLFVAAKVIKALESKLWELMDKLSFAVGDGQ